MVNDTTEDNPLAGFLADLLQEETDSEEAVVDMLWLYDKYRSEESKAKADKENLGTKIKNHLRTHDGEEVVDGERGWRAAMQTKKGSRKCDLKALYEGNKVLFEQLLYNGCLTHNEDGIATAGALVAGVERYMTPYGETQSLQVVRVKS